VQITGLPEGGQHDRCGIPRVRVGDLLAHDRPQLATATRVETGRRLVEEDEPGPGDEHHREIQPPLHAAGVGLRPPVGRLDEVDAFQHHSHGVGGGRPVQVRQVGPQPQVLAAGEQLVDR
jgi:hypothetical protein